MKLRNFGTDVGRSNDDHDIDIRRGGTSGSWRKTKAGLILILICTITALVIWGLAGLPAAEGDRHDGGWGPFYAVMLVAMTYPVLVFATFIGVCLCCTAPYPPARKRAVVCALLILGAPMVPMLYWHLKIEIITDPNGAGGLRFPALALSPLIGATVFWYLFHFAVAVYFQNAFLRKFSILTMFSTLAMFSLFALFVVAGDTSRWLGVCPRFLILASSQEYQSGLVGMIWR